MLKYLILSFLAVSLVLEAANCFSYEAFEHDSQENVGNRALARYNYQQIRDNHFDFDNVGDVSVLFGQGNNNVWNINQFIAPQINLNDLENIDLMITRRLAHGVDVSSVLIEKLEHAQNAGIVTNELTKALTLGGYFNPIESIFNSLTLNPFPPGTVLGIPINNPIPTRIVVHFAIPQRVSRNIKEISQSSLLTGDDLTLKDKIDTLYTEIGLPRPDSATVISSNRLQD